MWVTCDYCQFTCKDFKCIKNMYCTYVKKKKKLLVSGYHPTKGKCKFEQKGVEKDLNEEITCLKWEKFISIKNLYMINLKFFYLNLLTLKL